MQQSFESRNLEKSADSFHIRWSGIFSELVVYLELSTFCVFFSMLQYFYGCAEMSGSATKSPRYVAPEFSQKP